MQVIKWEIRTRMEQMNLLRHKVADGHPQFLFILFNWDILEFLQKIWGNLEKFRAKNACVTHMSHFPSIKTRMANRMVTLRIFDTLLRYIANF
jgi:hypothetical protein